MLISKFWILQTRPYYSLLSDFPFNQLPDQNIFSGTKAIVQKMFLIPSKTFLWKNYLIIERMFASLKCMWIIKCTFHTPLGNFPLAVTSFQSNFSPSSFPCIDETPKNALSRQPLPLRQPWECNINTVLFKTETQNPRQIVPQQNGLTLPPPLSEQVSSCALFPAPKSYFYLLYATLHCEWGAVGL